MRYRWRAAADAASRQGTQRQRPWEYMAGVPWASGIARLLLAADDGQDPFRYRRRDAAAGDSDRRQLRLSSPAPPGLALQRGYASANLLQYVGVPLTLRGLLGKPGVLLDVARERG